MSFDAQNGGNDISKPIPLKRTIITSPTDEKRKLRFSNERRNVKKTSDQSCSAQESHKVSERKLYLPDGRSVVFILSKPKVSFPYFFFNRKCYRQFQFMKTLNRVNNFN